MTSENEDPRVAAFRILRSAARRASEGGEHSKAEELLSFAKQQAITIFGFSHGEVGAILLQLADVCDQLGQKKRAAELRNETDRIMEFYKTDFENDRIGNGSH